MRYVLLLSLFLVQMVVSAQITTIPELPVATQKVVIDFNSAEDSRLKYYTGDLYAHTGVIVEGKTDWQNVIGSWANNATQPKLTNLGNGRYSLEITPTIENFYAVAQGIKILKMAFVFRSPDGNQQTNDLFIDVYLEGLAVDLKLPYHLTILEIDATQKLEAFASEDAQLSLKLGSETVKSIFGKSISFDKEFTEAGNFWIYAIAEKDGIVKTDSAYLCVRAATVMEDMPAGTRKGISYPNNQSARLALYAPYKNHVFVIGDFNNWMPDNQFQMKKDGDTFWLDIPNLIPGKEYIFQYYMDGQLKIADPYAEKISDPWNDSYISSATYPGLISYPKNKTEGIASVLQPGQHLYTWQVNNFVPPAKEKLVIYEMLIRDFTAEHTYQSVIDKLDYLSDLRINVLELMPVNEFEGNSSWGYNPSFYFAPDKYYGPKNSLKKLIDECHKRGIAVVIDMVLNHSFGQSPLVRMYWDETNNRPAVNNPWYNQQSNFRNPDAQWGYDFNHESEATRQLIDSINSFWLNEYKVDGFRFDFTKGFSNTVFGTSDWGSAYDAPRIANLKRMANEIWKRNANAYVICEHLSDNQEEKELANHSMLLWGNMNHNYAEAAMGYHDGGKSNLSWGLHTQRGWDKPHLVSYPESHDEERVAYKCLTWGNSTATYNIKTVEETMNRVAMNALFHLPLPGPKMIWQMGEVGYDYSIDYNGRVGEKPIVWNYTQNDSRKALFKTMAQLNYLKTSYPEFDTPTITHSLTGSVKQYRLSKGEHHVVAIGNFGTTPSQVTVSFPVAGKWYSYFDRRNLSLNQTTVSISLEPGEYRLYSTRQFEKPVVAILPDSSDSSSGSLKVYPNPVFNSLTIDGDGIGMLQLYNSNGQLVKNSDIAGLSGIMEMDMQELPNGLYILQIQNSEGKPERFKILKALKL